jgi:OmpA-OmpF porin, OOP family
MKKLLTVLVLLASYKSFSQTYERKWNVGIHGGASQYNGEFRNDFYRFDQPFYGHAGISVSRYLTRHLDASMMVTRGELGHFQHKRFLGDPERNKFLIRLNTANFFIRYNFLPSDSRFRPFLFAGAGILNQYSLDNDVIVRSRNVDAAFPELGAGLTYALNDIISLQYQETFMYTGNDVMDFKTGGGNDSYLFHTLGITFNLGKGKCTEKGGVGDRIDRCSDVSKRNRKN